MTWQVIAGFITACVAIIGTVIKLFEFIRDRARVEISFEPEVYGAPTGKPECYRVVTVTNRGRRPVTIQDMGVEYRNARPHRAVIYWPAGGTPRTLDESVSVNGFILRDAVDLMSVSRAFAQGSDGKIYRSPKYKYVKTS